MNKVRTSEICCRAVMRDGQVEPCERPADHVAYDREGLIVHAGGDWYPACRQHRDQSLTGVHHHRPEVRDVLHAAVLTLGVMAA